MPDETRQAETVVTQENFQEFVDKKLGTEAAQAEPAPEEVKEPVEPEKVEAEPEEKEEKSEESRKKTPMPKIERRFSELTEQRKAAEAARDAERAAREAADRKVAELEAKLNPPKTETEAEPTPDQFQDPNEYAKALAKFTVDKAMKERDAREADSRQQSERERAIRAWDERQIAVKSELPDYETKIAEAKVMVSNELRDEIVASEVGPKILYHLAEHPEVAEKLSKMTIAGMLKEFGKLEARLEVAGKPAPKSETVAVPAPKVEISKAPAPISPLKGANIAVTDLPVNSKGEWTGTFAEYKAAVAAGKIK